jgi:ketosteroid isomerase-like protein
MSQETVDLVRRAIGAYNRRDLEAIRALNDPEMHLDWSASRGLEAGNYHGREATIGFYRNFFETFERVVIEPERFIESGDSVVVPNTARLQGRDGVETVARSALLFEIRSGRIVRVRLYQETREALEALGLPESV